MQRRHTLSNWRTRDHRGEKEEEELEGEVEEEEEEYLPPVEEVSGMSISLDTHY